jgi:glyoxylase-like metal-dependent hydrolase (beta-lactamase superfamily II)
MRKLILTIIVVFSLIALLVFGRVRIFISLMFSDVPPDLLETTDEGNDVIWFDDYYIVKEIDANTYAIGEPRYHQQNVNYLIIGTERAVLFDAGTGLRNILPVVNSLTDKPVTFIPSHFHFDHVGNGITFDHVAVVDLPHIRPRVIDGKLNLTWKEHLPTEGFDLAVLNVDEWLTPNGWIELGDRSLRVLYTPGHTDDSISLLDEQHNYLFTGDFMYTGPLFAFLPNSSMGDYLQGASTLLSVAPEDSRIFGSHRFGPPGIPEQSLLDVHALGQKLRSIREGELSGKGIFPKVYDINDTMQLLSDATWFQNWEQRYPELEL